MVRLYQLHDQAIAPSRFGYANIHFFLSPDEKTKQELVSNYGIDEHTLNSALDPEELSRIEFEPNHIAIIFKRAKNYSAEDKFFFRVVSAGMFLFDDALFIVSDEDLSLFEGKHFQKVHSLHEVMLRVLSSTIVHFYDHLKIINSVSVDIEQKINTSLENKHLINMFALEKSLVYYLNAVNANGIVLEKLRMNAAKLNLDPECQELLEDIRIENRQCAKQAEIYSNILGSLMDARVSIVNNNLNVLMKTLTKITLLLMAPTFIVSLFSVNVPFPFQGTRFGFSIILGMAVASVAAILAFFRRKGW
jgi:magnesium transporter